MTAGTLNRAPAADERRRRGRPVGDRDRRRAGLIDAAMAVMSEEGFAGTSLRRVAKRAGCTTGTVSYYFANKGAMIEAIVESRFDEFDRLLEIARDATSLRQMFVRWLESATGEPGWVAGVQLLTHARYEPALAATFQRRYARFRSALSAMLAAGQRWGRIRDDIPAELLADQLCAMGDGWMMLYPIEPERFGAERLGSLLDATTALMAPAGRTQAAR